MKKCTRLLSLALSIILLCTSMSAAQIPFYPDNMKYAPEISLGETVTYTYDDFEYYNKQLVKFIAPCTGTLTCDFIMTITGNSMEIASENSAVIADSYGNVIGDYTTIKSNRFEGNPIAKKGEIQRNNEFFNQQIPAGTYFIAFFCSRSRFSFYGSYKLEVTTLFTPCPHENSTSTVIAEPTCSEYGKIKLQCEDCGDVIEENIEKLPHSYGEWNIHTEASCTAAGRRSRVCSICNYLNEESIEKLPHSNGEWTIETEETCKSTGKRYCICETCGKKTYETIPKAEHDYGKWIVKTKATCEKTGEKYRVCENCDNKESETIPKTSHSYSEWEIKKEATESQAGSKTRTCEICDDTQTKTIDKLKHGGETKWVVTKEATCTSIGSRTKICKYCEKTISTEKIPLIEHIVKNWEVTNPAKPNSHGTKEGVCTVCGKTVEFFFDYDPEAVPRLKAFVRSRNYENKFSDVSTDKWFYSHVKKAYEYTFVNGMSEKKFSPDSKFTVAQALTVAANMHTLYYGYRIPKKSENEKWYAPAANYCQNNGIGDQEIFSGTLERNITRGEMAIIFASVLPQEEYKEVLTSKAPDVTSTMKCSSAVEKLYKAGIVTGDAKTGNYRPNDEIVRSEACVIFIRVAVPENRVK